MSRREAILKKLQDVAVVEWFGRTYPVVRSDLVFDGDEDDEPFFEPNITVLYHYSDNAGTWAEMDIYLDELVDATDTKFYSLKELSLESDDEDE